MTCFVGLYLVIVRTLVLIMSGRQHQPGRFVHVYVEVNTAYHSGSFESISGHLHGRSVSALDHRSLPPEFESQRGYI